MGRPRKYLVSGLVTISVYTVVEAENPEDAAAEAMLRPMQDLYSPWGEEPNEEAEWCHSGELDGVVGKETIEVEYG